MFITGIDNCPHFSQCKFIDYKELQYFSFNDVFENDEDDEYSNLKLINLLFDKKENENINKENKVITEKVEDFNFESNFIKSSFDNNKNEEIKNENEKIYFLCLSCGKILNTKEILESHPKEEKHYIVMNLTDISIWCLECKNPLVKMTKKELL